MRVLIVAAAVAALTCSFASASYAQNAQQELMKNCNRDAAARQLKGTERKSYMSDCLSGHADRPQLTAQQQRMKDCNASAAGMSGSKRKDFMSSCLSGGSTTASAPSRTSSSRNEPSRETTGSASRERNESSAPSSRSDNGSIFGRWFDRDSRSTTGSAGGTQASAPGQFSNEATAKMSCGTDSVVWVNTESRIYHFKNNHNYGNTKAGAYMCERDARAGGSRAAKNEKRS